MSGPAPQRVRIRHVEWVVERLSARDWAILIDVGRLRLVTSRHLERLHFQDLSVAARARIRRRVLARLVTWRVLTTLERRIGGVRAGSAGLVFALDTAGQRLTERAASGDSGSRTVRRAELPGLAFTTHTLSVSELYVGLVEAARSDGFRLERFDAEPAAWAPNGFGGWLKPDAALTLTTDEVSDHWWVEVDKATEHLSTLRHKAVTYLDFYNRGQRDISGVMPRVLFTVPDERRLSGLQRLLDTLPEPASKLFHVTLETHAPAYVLRILRE